jgi:hypothetical protein
LSEKTPGKQSSHANGNIFSTIHGAPQFVDVHDTVRGEEEEEKIHSYID